MDEFEKMIMQEWCKKGLKTFDEIMGQILALGQSSLPENQFKAFKKMAIDCFAGGKRSLLEMENGRCGESKGMMKRVVSMRV